MNTVYVLFKNIYFQILFLTEKLLFITVSCQSLQTLTDNGEEDDWGIER